MAFWNNVKKAFGLDPAEEEADGERNNLGYDPSLPTYAVKRDEGYDEDAQLQTLTPMSEASPAAPPAPVDGETQPEAEQAEAETHVEATEETAMQAVTPQPEAKSANHTLVPVAIVPAEALDPLKQLVDDRFAQLAADIAALKSGMAEAASQTGHEQEIQELVKQLAEARQAAETANRRAEELGAQNSELQARVEAMNAQMEALTAKNQFQSEQVTKLREAVAVREREASAAAEKLTPLADENNRLRDRVDTLNRETASLRQTVENNLYNQANAESRLRREIKELRRQLEKKDAAAKRKDGDEPPKRGRKKKPAPAPGELDSTDWLVAERAAAYDKKQPRWDDAQMSLF